jgi:phenylacetic acid degradation operon negative regulatory protein
VSPTPRSLILNLMLGAEARGRAVMSVRELLAACGAFGLPGNSVRVALARAVAAGLLVAEQRGHYVLGPAARALADDVGRWRETRARLVDWSGEWVGVHVGATRRSDRPALRSRERAFGLLGLAEFERGLHLRPNNLAGGVTTLRTRLQALLPERAEPGTVFAIRDLAAADEVRARTLWDGAALDAGYHEATAQLADWIDHANELPLDRAAREAFTLGNDAIRRLVFDPLLPAPLVDARARARFFSTVSRFDAAGQAIWRRFLTAARARAAA